MKWPWVSRAAFDLLERELERVREQNTELLGQLLRVRRAETGLPELPRRPKEPKAEGKVPKDIMAHVQAFESRANRMALLQRISIARQDHTWDEIRELLEMDGAA